MTTAKQAAREQQSRIWHMYIWTRQPFFHAVAQAESVDEARELLLEEIGGGDGSCPEREKAAKWVREQQPTIFHRSNAEFSLTDSAELREQEAYVEKLQKEIKELKSALDSAGVRERDWRKMCITEIAAENQSVSDYVEHWEGRALKAEAALAHAKELL